MINCNIGILYVDNSCCCLGWGIIRIVGKDVVLLCCCVSKIDYCVWIIGDEVIVLCGRNMVICIDSGCIIMNFDVIGCGFSYINSECICVNLVKVLEVVSIIVIGFNGIVCFEIDNRVFLYVYFYGVVVLNIDC